MGSGDPENYYLQEAGKRKAMSCRIVIADDHQIVRQGLRTLLEQEPDLEVVGEAENGRNTLALIRELVPHVVVMDVKMPDLNGIEATFQILSEFPQMKVIALSMYSDRRFVINMLRAGALGYLLKECAFEELVKAIRLAMANRTYLSPGISDIVIKDYFAENPGKSKSVFAVLTAREREVLQLLSEGKRTIQIAELLNISVKTVETHRQQIMHKLQIRSVAELTKYAIREGLTSVEH
ncbi:MAG: response regulator transcription factor [Desulfobaccales bacterium]